MQGGRDDEFFYEKNRGLPSCSPCHQKNGEEEEEDGRGRDRVSSLGVSDFHFQRSTRSSTWLDRRSQRWWHFPVAWMSQKPSVGAFKRRTANRVKVEARRC